MNKIITTPRMGIFFFSLVLTCQAWGAIKFIDRDRDVKKISSYYEYLKNGVHKPRLNKRVIKTLSANKELFKDEISLIQLQDTINSTKGFSKNCRIENFSFTKKVAEFHYLQVLRFCHSKLLKSKKEEELQDNELLFIRKFYSKLLDTGNMGIIRLKRNDSVYPKALAQVISSKDLDVDDITDLFQRTYIGKHINYGSELTSHLQHIGIFPAKESKLFKNEFRNLCSIALKKLEDTSIDQHLEHVLSFYKENRNLIGHVYSNKKFRQLSRNLLRKGKTKVAKRFINKAVTTQLKQYRPPPLF